MVIHLNPVPKLGNIAEIEKEYLVSKPPVLIKETGSALNFFLATCCYYQWYQCPFLGPWVHVVTFFYHLVVVYQTVQLEYL